MTKEAKLKAFFSHLNQYKEKEDVIMINKKLKNNLINRVNNTSDILDYNNPSMIEEPDFWDVY
tara:strand:+ start:397 stop:585 length:189 start_codon:yes stop_codon:yes gene_type:complete